MPDRNLRSIHTSDSDFPGKEAPVNVTNVVDSTRKQKTGSDGGGGSVHGAASQAPVGNGTIVGVLVAGGQVSGGQAAGGQVSGGQVAGDQAAAVRGGPGGRAPRYSKTPRTQKVPEPDNLEFYPVHWQVVLKGGKLHLWRWVAVVEPFPDKNEYYGKTETFLFQSLNEYQAAGGLVEDGKSSLFQSDGIHWEISLRIFQPP